MTNNDEMALKLKAAAEKATPGEWAYLPTNTSIEYDVGSDDSQGSIVYMDSGDFTKKQTDLNGEFIAAANPANILALLTEREADKEEIEKLRVSNRILASDAIWKQERIAELEALTAEQDQRLITYAAIATKNATESRTVSIKLPEPPGPMSVGARTVYCGIVADVVAAFKTGLDDAGIKLEVGE